MNQSVDIDNIYYGSWNLL